MNIVKVSSVAEAITKLNEGYKPLAGCTNVLVDINKKGDDGKTYVSLNGLNELKGISSNDGLTFGSLVTFSEMEEALKDNKQYKAFYDCAYSMGSPQIRNVATLGGNIADASPACDLAPSLLVFDATITVNGVDGERKINVNDFFKGVRKTTLKQNELITKIEVESFNGKSFFKKVGLRNALTISVVSLAGAFDNGKVSLAMGSVAPTPIRLRNVENYVNSVKEISLEVLKEQLNKDICPISDVRASMEYRKEVAFNLVVDSLRKEFGYEL